MTEAMACKSEIKLKFRIFPGNEKKSFHIFGQIENFGMGKASLAPELVLLVMDMEMYWPMISSFLPHLVNPQNQFSDHALHTKAFVDFQDSRVLKITRWKSWILDKSNKSLTMQSTVISAVVSTVIWRRCAMLQMTSRATVLIGCWNIWRIATTTSVQFWWFRRI